MLELLPLLQSRQLSARELVESCIRRADILEPQVRAFITRTDELALQPADAVDRDRAAGR